MEFSSLKEITKAYTEGIYADTPANRKLGRVGMSYTAYAAKIKGESGKEEKKEETSILINIQDYKKIPTKATLKKASWNTLRDCLGRVSSQITNIKNDINNPNVPLFARSEHVQTCKAAIRRGTVLKKTIEDVMKEKQEETAKKANLIPEKESIPSYRLEDQLFDSADGSMKDLSKDKITDMLLNGDKKQFGFTNYKNTYLAVKEKVNGEDRVSYFKVNKKTEETKKGRKESPWDSVAAMNRSLGFNLPSNAKLKDGKITFTTAFYALGNGKGDTFMHNFVDNCAYKVVVPKTRNYEGRSTITSNDGGETFQGDHIWTTKWEFEKNGETFLLERNQVAEKKCYYTLSKK